MTSVQDVDGETKFERVRSSGRLTKDIHFFTETSSQPLEIV